MRLFGSLGTDLSDRSAERATFQQRVYRALGFSSLILVALAASAFAGYRLWLASGDRSSLQMQLDRGLHYRRLPISTPRRAVAHILKIDLKAGGMRMHLSAPEPGTRCMRARTTEQFLQQHDLRVAINAAFFHPFWSKSPWQYYPKVGECAYPLGVWRAQGRLYGDAWKGTSLSFGADLAPQLGPGSQVTPWTVTGAAVLVEEGRALKQGRVALDGKPYPRNALCLDRPRSTLLAILIDGRQPGYSEGLTLGELADFAAQQGCDYAIELDGGGSVTLVARGEDGRTRVLNRPIHTRIPGRQRPVANHIGFATASARDEM